VWFSYLSDADEDSAASSRRAPPSERKKHGLEMVNMTKTDLIEGLSNRLGLVKIDAERVVDGVLDAITEALKHGDRVNLSGFGTFAVSAREARTGRNPKTGESIEISASRSAKFKPGKQLKESLNAAPAASEPD
jgi:DNA-binding protein HU-beta